MAELKVSVFSHNFVVTRITPRARTAVELFCKKYVQYGTVKVGHKWQKAMLKVFAAATKNRLEYRFHINQFKDFKAHLEFHGLTGVLVEFVANPIPLYVNVTLPIFPHWKSYDYQEPVIEYICAAGEPRSKFVDLQTGKGKSYCSLAAASIMGTPIVLMVRPMYIDKWLIDIRKTYDIEIEDCLVIQGEKSLLALLAAAEEGKPVAKIVLMSNKTFQLWIKKYEEYGDAILDMGYACLPGDFYEHIGAGLRIIDEVHSDFHLNFKIDLYTNVAHSVSLSATLLSDDAFINRMYEIAYPKYQQYKGPAYDKYIAARSIIYRLKEPDKVRFQDWASNRYSHNTYENSILKNDNLCQNYMAMINEIIKFSYIKNYKEGHRLIIFCSSITFCTRLTAYLADKYPHFDVRRYVEDDEFVNVMEPDIRVTTLLSAGTAIDIPMLQTTILTTAVSSSQSNIQGLGRLRKMADGTTPEFIWLTCESIPAHITYHEKKRLMLEDRVISYRNDVMPIAI